MSPDRSRPGGTPAWKAAAGSGKPPKGPQFAWKPGDQAAQPSFWARRLKLGGLVVGGLACAALVVLLIIWLRPQKGACLVLVGADPVADVEKLDAPLDVYGWRGGERLAEWSTQAAEAERARGTHLTPQLIDPGQLAPDSLRPADLPVWLQKLEKRELNPLVVYLGLHGAADAAGPFLFAAGGEKLYLRDLIQGFADSSGLRDKQIVLLLDPARLTPDPAAGVLHNDCVRALKGLEADGLFAKVPNLVVICASDEGERSWAAEEWGTTAFAEMLVRGLSGAATPSKGAVITAGDLFAYVRDQVQGWSRATRPAPQTPVLLPAADGPARAERIALTAQVGSPADWPQQAPSAVPQPLLNHWTTCKALEDSTPSPAVYTPELWRRYRELLLRYGHLVRAGADAAATRLVKELDADEAVLSVGRGLQLGGQPPQSWGNALPLPAALGLAAGTTGSDGPFNRMWDAPEADWDKLWADALKADGAKPEALRARFYDYLLKRATDPAAPPDAPDKAARLTAWRGLSAAGVPRPAEAHLLVMTHEFFDKVEGGKPPAELWKRALVVRRLAERAALGVNPPAGGGVPPHPYSERLWVHLGPAVVEADIRRRDGEDWLFASQDAGWTRSRQDLDAAAKQYDDVLRQAQSLQAAYAARDEALADLPLLTRWVASQPARQGDSRVEDLKDLWLTKVHPLARRLDGPDRPAGLEKLTEDVRQGVARLKQDYRDRCRDLADRDLQGVWEQVEQALAVPPLVIDPDTRRKLAESSRRQTAKLSSEWVANPKAVAAPAGATADDVKAARRAQGLQWGRLAAAVLGELPKDQRADRKGELLTAEGIQNELAKLPQDNWQPAVDVLGEQVGRHWRLLAAAPDKDAPVDDNRAEARSRWAVAFRPLDGPEPATVNRQKRWQNLLVGLALRTARDHWYDSEKEKRPRQYFDAAATLYLEDARRAVGDGSAAAPGEGPVKDLLRADALVLEPVGFGQRVGWTSENRRTLTFAVKAPKAGPGGYVTLWPHLNPSASLSVAGDDLPRVPARLEADPPTKRDVHVEAKRTATDDTVKLTANGYFRGQWLKAETEIKLNRTPELILTRAAPPPDAAVAVRAADNLDLGAIAIVLDFSGSMAQRPSGKPDWTKDDSKNQQALATLRAVLLGLPEGTPVSIRQFGHAASLNQQQYANRYRQLRNPTDEDAEVIGTEETRSELFYRGKVTWTAANPRPLEQILTRLNTEPKGGTPLLKTMIEAKEDFPDDDSLPKTLLVLTDGEDTLYPRAQRATKIPQLLQKEFGDGKINIQMVLFRVSADELERAKKQFAAVQTKFQPPGRIWEAEDKEKLAKAIDQALRPKLRLKDLAGRVPEGVPPSGLPANRPNDELINLRWTGAVLPGPYVGQVFRSTQRIALAAGDRLLVKLSKESTGVRFGRALLADEPRLKARSVRSDEWVMSLPYYHEAATTRGNPLWLTTTLESLAGLEPRRDDELQQTRPGFVWWDVAPQGGEPPTTVRMTERPQLPAPAWTAGADGWPGGVGRYRPATIKAWVALAPPAADARVKLNVAAIAAGEATATTTDEDGKVQVFASLEDWPLRTDVDPKKDFGNADPPRIQCLVVRVLHPDKKPVFVRPAGVTFDASEQRFYGPSAAVTAVFQTNKDQLDAKLPGGVLELDLVSVEKFKADRKPLVLEMGPARPEAPLIKLNPPERAGDKGK